MLWIAVALPFLPLEAVRPPLLSPDDDFAGGAEAGGIEGLAGALAGAPSRISNQSSNQSSSRTTNQSSQRGSKSGSKSGAPARRGTSATPAHALLEQGRIVLVDAQALALGVQVGLSRSHALALAPELCLSIRDPRREQRALEAVALSLLAYTPHVVLGERHTVLLEVGAGLRLFGGLRALLRKIATVLGHCGHVQRLGCAPTAWGAWLLAQARLCAPRGGRWRVLKHAGLGHVLDTLPVALLPSMAQHGDTFEQIGCATLGALRRLPRAGVTRRFGDGVLSMLAQAYGEAADPREAFRAPLSFQARIELMARVDSTVALLFAARRLLLQLAGWLSAHHAALSGYTLLLVHEPATRGAPKTSRLPVAWSLPSRDAEHLTWLLREKLQQTSLVAPVLELALLADQVSAHAPESDTLFPAPSAERDQTARLFERLSARLGTQRVLQIVAYDDHRPEAAVRYEPLRAAGAAGAAQGGKPASKRRRTLSAPAQETCGAPGMRRAAAACTAGADGKLPRPAWLLEKLVPLTIRGERPVYGTALRMVAGPERIEAGWWDGQGVARDYFIAADASERLYWIFRERPNGGWFLQGLFG